MRRTRTLVHLVAAAMSVVVAEARAQDAPAPPHGDVPCPLGIPNASVAAQPDARGAALLFRADSEDVQALRQRVRRLAELHNATGGRLVAAAAPPAPPHRPAPPPQPPPEAPQAGAQTRQPGAQPPEAPPPAQEPLAEQPPPAPRGPSGADGLSAREGPGPAARAAVPPFFICCAAGFAEAPPSLATVEDTPDGARVVFAPDEPGRVGLLRMAVREQGLRSGMGLCPIAQP